MKGYLPIIIFESFPLRYKQVYSSQYEAFCSPWTIWTKRFECASPASLVNPWVNQWLQLQYFFTSLHHITIIIIIHYAASAANQRERERERERDFRRVFGQRSSQKLKSKEKKANEGSWVLFTPGPNWRIFFFFFRFVKLTSRFKLRSWPLASREAS